MRKLFTFRAKKEKSDKGYLLIATILLGLGLSIVAGANLQFTAQTNQDLVVQSYMASAREAAQAGIQYAGSCLASNSSDWSTLTPGSTCSGSGGGSSSNYVVEHPGEWRSTFSVNEPDAIGNILATGTVEVLSGSTVVKRYTATTKMNASTFVRTYPISVGESITDIQNDDSDCAIANGKLYCWGDNRNGQIGDGTTTDRGTPFLVQGAMAGKTVTRVSVSTSNVCAIADGEPYCWGGNGNEQLGDGTRASKRVPTGNTPRSSTGPLSGQIVTDIGTASWNNPANFIWPFATAFPHSCALTADGSVSCWGDGSFRQNTGGGMGMICVLLCIPTGFYYYPSYDVPTLTIGYVEADQELSGKKSERVGASSHDSCSYAEGKLICWGVQAPIAIWCNSVLFSGAWETIVPFNPCVGSYSNGYDTHAIWGSDLSGKFIDVNSWNVSANEGCFMANTDLVCFGTSPAFGLFWLPGAWGPPWISQGDADVTSADNGDNATTLGTIGIFCIIDAGVGKCAGSPFNNATGTGASGYNNFQPLIETTGLSGKVPTKIAAGQDHGCVIANGQLLCWGNGISGHLADGDTSSHYVATPTLGGRTGSTPIGTVQGTLAASGQISTGGGHSCGVVNGKLFCWGDNSYGQLGMGNTIDLSKPQTLPTLGAYKSVTAVSAGQNHTCAIIRGQVMCWGRNDQGQLGIGNTTDQNVPRLVGGALAGKRVTAIAAGYNTTCAIANAQAYCWGYNANQQVGDGSTNRRVSPVAVSGNGNILTGKAVTSISVGTSHACATANGDLFCWGSNANGRTGLNTTTGNSNPTRVTGGDAGTPRGPNNVLPLVTSVSAGDDFTCAIINAKAACWGNNANGRTGRNTTTGNSLTPGFVSGSAGTYHATMISAGDDHACAVINGNRSADNGNLWCWGMGTNGRIGNNSATDRPTPQLVNGGATVDTSGDRRVAVSVDVGGATSCSVANAVILCWGYGADGRLGNNTISDSLVPVTTSDYRVLSPYDKGPVF